MFCEVRQENEMYTSGKQQCYIVYVLVVLEIFVNDA